MLIDYYLYKKQQSDAIRAIINLQDINKGLLILYKYKALCYQNDDTETL